MFNHPIELARPSKTGHLDLCSFIEAQVNRRKHFIIWMIATNMIEKLMMLEGSLAHTACLDDAM